MNKKQQKQQKQTKTTKTTKTTKRNKNKQKQKKNKKKQKKANKKMYQEILETDYDGTIKFVDLKEKNENLVKTMTEFLNTYYDDNKRICISLSGGVDSMVLMRILKCMRKDVIAFHINYNNISNDEADFLKYYCELLEVPLILKKFEMKRDETDRKLYESITRDLKNTKTL